MIGNLTVCVSSLVKRYLASLLYNLHYRTKSSKVYLPNLFVYRHCPLLLGSNEYTAKILSSGNPWWLGTNVANNVSSCAISALASLWSLLCDTTMFAESKISKSVKTENIE